MRIGVFASMKKGLEHFIYREVLFLNKHGAEISLYPTKYGPGLYNPADNWRVHRWSTIAVLCFQPIMAIKLGRRYWAAFAYAIKKRALADFLLAAYFCRSIGDVDVLHATFGDRKLFVAFFCKRISGKPLAVTLHAYELYANPNPDLFRQALSECDQIITISDYNRELLEREYGIAKERIEVVRCGLDLHEYRPEKKFIILIVGFFVYRKGHEVLFRALKKLNRDDIEVWVVGGLGAEEDVVDVPSMVKEMELESQVAFFGTLRGTALKAVYRACDVFCLPCRTEKNGVSEGFPCVLMEAMALGKPVITSRHVEIPRIINEILVDENDVDGLAHAIQLSMSSQELRDRLSMESRQLAETHFSSVNASKTEAIFRRLCGHDAQESPLADPIDAESQQTNPFEQASRATTDGELRS